MLRFATILLVVSCLTACASIVSGTSQKINLSTTPQAQVVCDVKNKRGESSVLSAPSIVEVKRSKTDLNITCNGAEYSGEYTNESDIESWAAGNLLLGGIIGGIVDASTGALYSYDDAINVPLAPKKEAMVPTDNSHTLTAPSSDAPGYTPPVQSNPAPASPPSNININLNTQEDSTSQGSHAK